MTQLNLPSFTFRTKTVDNRTFIFDAIRKKFVSLTPEEWVRQNMIKYLETGKNYPPSLMAVETLVNVNGLKQRADIVVYNRLGKPVMIVECKAPAVPLTNLVFEQAARYNLNLQVDYLLLTNGMKHYCAKLEYSTQSYTMMNRIPDFSELH